MKQFYSLAEVAEILQIPVETAYQLRRKGEIEAHRFGRHLRVSEEQLGKFTDAALTRQEERS